MSQNFCKAHAFEYDVDRATIEEPIEMRCPKLGNCTFGAKTLECLEYQDGIATNCSGLTSQFNCRRGKHFEGNPMLGGPKEEEIVNGVIFLDKLYESAIRRKHEISLEGVNNE